jgi:GTPase SAR1 family protein
MDSTNNKRARNGNNGAQKPPKKKAAHEKAEERDLARMTDAEPFSLSYLPRKTREMLFNMISQVESKCGIQSVTTRVMVIGGQSAGKSTVIKQMTKVDLPVDEAMCTKTLLRIAVKSMQTCPLRYMVRSELGNINTGFDAPAGVYDQLCAINKMLTKPSWSRIVNLECNLAGVEPLVVIDTPGKRADMSPDDHRDWKNLITQDNPVLVFVMPLNGGNIVSADTLDSFRKTLVKANCLGNARIVLVVNKMDGLPGIRNREALEKEFQGLYELFKPARSLHIALVQSVDPTISDGHDYAAHRASEMRLLQTYTPNLPEGVVIKGVEALYGTLCSFYYADIRKDGLGPCREHLVASIAETREKLVTAGKVTDPKKLAPRLAEALRRNKKIETEQLQIDKHLFQAMAEFLESYFQDHPFPSPDEYPTNTRDFGVPSDVIASHAAENSREYVQRTLREVSGKVGELLVAVILPVHETYVAQALGEHRRYPVLYGQIMRHLGAFHRDPKVVALLRGIIESLFHIWSFSPALVPNSQPHPLWPSTFKLRDVAAQRAAAVRSGTSRVILELTIREMIFGLFNAAVGHIMPTITCLYVKLIHDHADAILDHFQGCPEIRESNEEDVARLQDHLAQLQETLQTVEDLCNATTPEGVPLIPQAGSVVDRIKAWWSR